MHRVGLSSTSPAPLRRVLFSGHLSHPIVWHCTGKHILPPIIVRIIGRPSLRPPLIPQVRVLTHRRGEHGRTRREEPRPLRRMSSPAVRYAPTMTEKSSNVQKMPTPALAFRWHIGPKGGARRKGSDNAVANCSQFKWRDPDLNRGHHDFQSCALPTELSRHGRSATESSRHAQACRSIGRALNTSRAAPDFQGTTPPPLWPLFVRSQLGLIHRGLAADQVPREPLVARSKRRYHHVYI